ncbi:MAG: hypothetical protein HQK66_03085 [Desulfamplus sp.]|nr:hypothetical protein [Desulfamplus sp.]
MQSIQSREISSRIARKTEVACLRREVLAKPPEKALDTILENPFPVAFVQSFPDQDLHFLMHHIGEEDFLPVLSLAASSQWEYLMDAEVWKGDRIDMVETTRMLSLLFKADPQRLLRWTIMEKPGFLEYYLFRNMEIRIREHDEDPSDFGDGFETIDSVFYFRFPLAYPGAQDTDPINLPGRTPAPPGHENDMDISTANNINQNAQEAALLITEMLNTLADMDISVYHGVMHETGSVIPAEVEEEEFRLKNIRLEEKGFLPYHEAVAVYQPLDPENLTLRPPFYLEKSLYSDDLPLPPQFPFSTAKHANPFVESLGEIEGDALVNLQSEFAFLVNSMISADKKIIRLAGELHKSVQGCCSYLSLGLGIIHSHICRGQIKGKESPGSSPPFSPEAGASIIRKYALKDIFRVASYAGIKLKSRLEKWYSRSWLVSKNLKLTFLDELWLGMAGGLMLDRPLFFDNYETGLLYRPFASTRDIDKTSIEIDAIIMIDRMLSILNPHPALLGRPFVTWKPIFLTMWVKDRMGGKVDSSSRSSTASSVKDGMGGKVGEPFIGLKPFIPFFEQMFSREKEKKAVPSTVRKDFFDWLEGCGVLGAGQDNSDGDNALAARVFNDLLDEIEDEYGNVAPTDIVPDLMPHFIIDIK